MLTRFISDKSYDTLDVEYSHDSNVKIENVKIGVDGNINYTSVPILSSIKDLKINNYVLNIISRNDQLSNFIDLEQDNDVKNKSCLFYSNSSIDSYREGIFWKFINDGSISTSTFFNDLGDVNIFEIDFINDNLCKIYYNENDLKYILAYSLALSTVKAIPSTDKNLNFYTTEFNYNLAKNNKIVFFVQSNLGLFSLIKSNGQLKIKQTLNLNEDNDFYIKKIDNLNELKNANNWICYENTFNTNNLKLNENRSYFDVKNNFLFSTIVNSVLSSLPINILTLKNQLNQENDQSRGNVFINENETNLKEYESIFTGGYRELGYDKINLGYTSYSTPFTFKSGKTTYFHVPHDIYPYKQLNVNSSKLAESGAIGGNSPLNSDKIWKKLKDYRDTSPYSDPRDEQTGQWLCTWLSAGNPDTRPIWVDRYYKPSKITPFLALSATSNEVMYIDSFNCLNLNDNISDVRSSLTFDKGSYYAYMHLGKKDYYNLITESISSKIYHTELDEYQKTNIKDLVAIDEIYSFDGESFGYIESNKKIEHNVVSFSFFAGKEDWNVPSGNMIFGNYVNNGFGFYNYNLNTPYSILKLNDNTLEVLNNSFSEIETLTTENITLCGIAGISRINAFENIHIITKDFRLIEMDLKGTIVDANSAIKDVLFLKSTDKIFSITNDEKNCYVHTSSGVAVIDLFSNIVTQGNISKIITTNYTASSYIIADNVGTLYRFYGKQPIFRNGYIYASDDNTKLFSYSTSYNILSTYINTLYKICCFNIDKNNNINIVTTEDKLDIYKGQTLVSSTNLPLLSTYSLSARVFNFCEKFEYGKLKTYKQIYCTNVKTNEPYIIQIDDSNNQSIIKLNKKYSLIQENLDLTNYNFNRAYMVDKYKEGNYNFKVKLLNRVNNEDFAELDFIIKGEDLATGMRHFVFSIDCYNGIANFFLDAQLYESKKFDSKKYTLTNTFGGRIFYGANAYFNGIPAFQHFEDISDFTYSDLKLSNNYIINKALDRYETLYFYNIVHPSEDLKYNMPSGTRSFIDKMEKTFNFNIPMFKSNYFNLKILNSGILYDQIKDDIQKHIREKIYEYLPNYTNLNDFEWLDTTSKPIIIEGDYDVSNTLTEL